VKTIRLTAVILAVLAVLAIGTWHVLFHTAAGARWLWSQAGRATGGALTAQEVSGDLASGLTIRQLGFDAEGVTVHATAVTLDVEIGLSPLTVAVGTARVSGLIVKLLDSSPGTTDGETALFELEKLQLPLVLTVAQLQLDDARLLRGEDTTLMAIEHATLAGRWADSIAIENLNLRNPTFDAGGDGRLRLQQPYELGIDVQVLLQPELTGLGKPVSGRITAEGPLDNFALEARSDAPRANLEGTIAGIRQSLQWNLVLEVPSATLPPEAGLPDVPPVSLSAEGSGGTRAFTAQATLGVAGTNTRASFSADVDLESGTVSGDVDWTDAQWPPADPHPRVASRRGRLAVSGSLDAWKIEGTVQLAVPDLPPGRFTVRGGGDRGRAEVRILDGEVLGGSIAGRAQYQWREPQTWSANLDLENVGTAALLPDWPATLSGGLELSGRQQPFDLAIELRDIRGEFRDKPLHARGKVNVRQGTVTAEALSLTHGGSSLQLDGGPYVAGGLRYSVAIEELGDYVGDAFGMLDADGVVSLLPGQPYLEIRAASPRLGYREAVMVDLEILDLRNDTDVMAVELTASEASYGDIVASGLRIDADAGRQAQSIEMVF
jgi:autotransporter translocation and assembly factor TamB